MDWRGLRGSYVQLSGQHRLVDIGKKVKALKWLRKAGGAPAPTQLMIGAHNCHTKFKSNNFKSPNVEDILSGSYGTYILTYM